MAIAQLAQFRFRHLKPALVAIDCRHADARFGKTEGRGAADAAASAGHHATRPERPSQSDDSIPVMSDHSWLVN